MLMASCGQKLSQRCQRCRSQPQLYRSLSRPASLSNTWLRLLVRRPSAAWCAKKMPEPLHGERLLHHGPLTTILGQQQVGRGGCRACGILWAFAVATVPTVPVPATVVQEFVPTCITVKHLAASPCKTAECRVVRKKRCPNHSTVRGCCITGL